MTPDVVFSRSLKGTMEGNDHYQGPESRAGFEVHYHDTLEDDRLAFHSEGWRASQSGLAFLFTDVLLNPRFTGLTDEVFALRLHIRVAQDEKIQSSHPIGHL